MEDSYILIILVMLASIFSESLLVSAESSSRSEMSRTIPFLCARIPALAVKSNLAIPTSCPMKRAGIFHVNGRPFEPKRNKNGDTLDVVKRFKMTTTRDLKIISEPIIVVPNENTPNQIGAMDLVCPWNLEYATLLELVGESYFEVGQNCSEKTYQLALVHKLYKHNVPCLMEKNIYTAEHGNPILKGRVDLEVASKYVLELKVSPASSSNIRKDKKQLRRYIEAYRASGIYLERAALVYYGSNQVRIIEVSVHDDEKLVNV